jgi:NTE family protein
MGNQTKRIAVVLAGAVAKGAFEAGVIRALVRADVDIVRIVATSSGALNGTVLAAAVRAGDLVGGAERLATLWQDHAEWNEVFHTSFRDILRRDGLSDQARLLGLLRDHIAPSQPDRPRPVNLRLIVAALGGCAGSIGARPATTFESVRDFQGDDFGSPHGLAGVFAAAVASSAFPLVFAPVAVDGVGPCVDGGAVNNTPMKWALDGAIGASVDAVVVIATSVEQRADPPGGLTGLGALGSHLAEMLIDERLYRDLREAEQVNAALERLDLLGTTGVLDAAQFSSVLDALGWNLRRRVEIVPIRPAEELPGNPFSAFLHRDARVQYLDVGYRRGLEVLGGLGWSHRPERPASVRHDDVVGAAGDAVELPRPVEGDRTE